MDQLLSCLHVLVLSEPSDQLVVRLLESAFLSTVLLCECIGLAIKEGDGHFLFDLDETLECLELLAHV